MKGIFMFENQDRQVFLSHTSYEIMKRVVQVILPAFASLYFGLAAIWNLPAAEQVVGTTAVFTTFLGVCLGISTSQYTKANPTFDGNMILREEDGKKLFSLELNVAPEELEKKDSIRFRVSDTPTVEN